MTIEEFYNLAALEIVPKPLSFILRHGFLKEVSSNPVFNQKTIENLKQTNAENRVRVEIVKYFSANPNSFFSIKQWTLASVWFDNEPVMVLRNKEYYPSDRYPDYFITDSDKHKELVWYVLNLLKEEVYRNLTYQEFNESQLFGDSILDRPQVIDDVENRDLVVAEVAINKMID